MKEHYRPWARWVVRYTSLLLACCHLAVQWHAHPLLSALLPSLPGLRLVPDCTFIVALQRVRIPRPACLAPLIYVCQRPTLHGSQPGRHAALNLPRDDMCARPLVWLCLP